MTLNVIAPRVEETTTGTGTGTVTMTATAAQCQSFLTAVGAGNGSPYVARSGNGSDWEEGWTLVANNGGSSQLSRDNIHWSTNGGAAISLSGTSTFFIPPTNNTLIRGLRGIKPTRPAGSTFSWLNQGSASYTEYTGGPLTMRAPKTSSDTFHCLEQSAAASSNLTVTAELEFIEFAQSFYLGGIFMKDSKGQLFLLYYQAGASNNQHVVAARLVPPLGITVMVDQGLNPVGRLWLRIRQDGTNLISYVSVNGSDWVEFYAEPATIFMSPTISTVGLVMSCSGTSGPGDALMSMWSFENVAGAGSTVSWI